MVFKRQFGEEGSDDSPVTNHSESSPTKYQKVFNYVLKETSLQEIAGKISSILEPTLRRVVKEEVESFLFFLHPSPRHSLVHLPESSASRVLQLHFTKKFPSTLFTNSSIHDEEHAPLQIVLVDVRSKNVIHHGALSSIKVEVVVLNADFAVDGREDWSESEFSHNIVREREGKRPLLVGDLALSLVNGSGCIDNVTFTDNSSWMRSRKFRLGVRAVSSASSDTSIREAVSDAFVVLDHRGEAYQKHNIPSLDDPVWRLKKISKMGASHKKLESHGIMTVKQFLMHYYTNPLFLRRVLGKGVPNRAWEVMVKHANECHLDNTQYSYYSAAEGVQLLFNCVCKVIAVKFDGQDYRSVDALDFRQKALVDKLKQHPFNQNELIQIPSSSAAPAFVSSTLQQNIPAVGLSLELEQEGPSIIDQDEPDRQLDFNLSDAASYPCTVKDGYLPEDDSTAQSNQPLKGFCPTTYLMGDSTSEPYEAGYNWFQNSSVSTFAPHNQFGELSQPQTSLFYPVATTWGQDNSLVSSSAPATPIEVFSHLPDFGVNTSSMGKPKAAWCKLRAAVMWKIVRRNVARRKDKFPCHYY